MTFSPVNVSNNILKRAFEDDVSVSPMKLQKLLYFVASEYSKRTGKPLLNEPFLAWDYGPVVRSVYDEFRSFGAAPIKAYAKDAAGRSKMIKESKDEALRVSLDLIWNQAKVLSGLQLSRITHADGSAWYKTFQKSRSGAIPDSDLHEDETYYAHLGLDRGRK